MYFFYLIGPRKIHTINRLMGEKNIQKKNRSEESRTYTGIHTENIVANIGLFSNIYSHHWTQRLYYFPKTNCSLFVLMSWLQSFSQNGSMSASKNVSVEVSKLIYSARPNLYKHAVFSALHLKAMIFTESAYWADSVSKLLSPSVCLFVSATFLCLKKRLFTPIYKNILFLAASENLNKSSVPLGAWNPQPDNI